VASAHKQDIQASPNAVGPTAITCACLQPLHMPAAFKRICPRHVLHPCASRMLCSSIAL
jgi:hypothetical protein